MSDQQGKIDPSLVNFDGVGGEQVRCRMESGGGGVRLKQTKG